MVGMGFDRIGGGWIDLVYMGWTKLNISYKFKMYIFSPLRHTIYWRNGT